jgi:hypothetical protein
MQRLSRHPWQNKVLRQRSQDRSRQASTRLAALALDLLLELVAGMKSHHPAGFDRDGLAGARVAARPRRLGADLEIAEAPKS